MSFIELMMIAVGLSMDAFAVSICKGLSIKNCAGIIFCLLAVILELFRLLCRFWAICLGYNFRCLLVV